MDPGNLTDENRVKATLGPTRSQFADLLKILMAEIGVEDTSVATYWARWAEDTGGDIGDEMRQRIAEHAQGSDNSDEEDPLDTSWCVGGTYVKRGSDPRVGKVAGIPGEHVAWVDWSDGKMERSKLVELTEASESDLTEEMRRGIEEASQTHP